eukprot:CAMPEP_0185818912 /NCGR_PEP_ID=MMETSP1322-20130828/21381_1 /TAXON_ID=265543 /ORGANISM="Minutocellus polymorphus, Strain RCC2270" /LENGTH=34 /DNA_ID= /DNA_START= /DNA_END= /DNA_ORIENTATION=
MSGRHLPSYSAHGRMSSSRSSSENNPEDDEPGFI